MTQSISSVPSSNMNNKSDSNSKRPLTSRRRRRNGALASVFLLATSCSFWNSCSFTSITITTNNGGNNYNSIVTAFSSPSTSKVLSSPCSSLFSTHIRKSTTNAKVRTRFAAVTTTSDDTSTSLSSSSSRNSNGIPSGSPLDMICKDQHDFELHVGRAMDTLRDDYPHILTISPDYSIYDTDIELVDPTGVRLHGVKNYKNVFRLLHAIVGIFYCPERSGLTFRMCFDKARQNIRIHWNAQVIPKAIFGGYKTTLHADGISVYEFDRNSGNITQHRLERLVINDNLVTPEQGIFAALRGHAIKSEVEGVPVFNMEISSATRIEGSNRKGNGNSNDFPNTFVQFQSNFPQVLSARGSVLFSDSEEEDRTTVSLRTSSSSTNLDAFSSSSAEQQSSNVNRRQQENHYQEQQQQSPQQHALSSSGMEQMLPPVDWEALEKKNVARKKFGLKPMTPEEFLELQDQVAELDSQQKEKAAAAAAAAAELARRQKQEQGNFVNKLFGDILKDTCETNFDCSYPEVCCDFGFKKMCCSSGLRILDGPPRSREGQLAEVPVIANPGPFPPDDYDPRRGRY